MIIGIDTGVHTGVAVWDGSEFVLLESMKILDAFDVVLSYDVKMLYIEDARLRTWYPAKGREVLQGVGSVKRDCKIWEDFAQKHDIPYTLIHPKDNATKLNAPLFNKFTGYSGKTNEHSRDAGMLVVGRKV